MQCPQCHCEISPDVEFCPICRARATVICIRCATANDLDHKFCKECGHRLTVPNVAPSAKYRSPDSYTPKYLADKIRTSVSLEDERKQVTVLFADIKGSLELIADRDPEDASHILDAVLRRMIEAIHHFEGTVNRVMGDGIMALFGAPAALENHAVRACYAALRMQENVKQFS